MPLLIIIKGTIGAKGKGNNPFSKAKLLGIKPIITAEERSKCITVIINKALTIGPDKNWWLKTKGAAIIKLAITKKEIIFDLARFNETNPALV